MDIMITLTKAKKCDGEKLYQLQVTGFAKLLNKYQDFDINPAAETIERVQSRLILCKKGK